MQQFLMKMIDLCRLQMVSCKLPYCVFSGFSYTKVTNWRDILYIFYQIYYQIFELYLAPNLNCYLIDVNCTFKVY